MSRNDGEIYPYYAGYSASFVSDVLTQLEVERNSVVLDPWNGGGTTTRIASRLGHEAYGFDINPTMAIVAKSYDLGQSNIASVKPLFDNIVKAGRNWDDFPINDPLMQWIDTDTCQAIRRLEFGIQTILMDHENYELISSKKSISSVSGIAAFFYVGLFNMMRESLGSFRSSNPSWVKTPKQEDDRLHIEPNLILNSYLDTIDMMSRSYQKIPSGQKEFGSTHIDTSDSRSLPLEDESIDAVITSPPYCTRIDYAKSTVIELSLLGFLPTGKFRTLRDGMIGTPTIIHDQKFVVNSDWGSTCVEFLKAVENHPSKSSKSYYYKTLIQYYDAIYNSIKEINRVLRRGGKGALVVQDSFFKDLRNDLPTIFQDMLRNQEFSSTGRIDNECIRNFVNVNTKAKNYTKSTAVESVLLFEKV
jgi:tRNA G10  N-methylase Trm11